MSYIESLDMKNLFNYFPNCYTFNTTTGIYTFSDPNSYLYGERDMSVYRGMAYTMFRFRDNLDSVTYSCLLPFFIAHADDELEYGTAGKAITLVKEQLSKIPIVDSTGLATQLEIMNGVLDNLQEQINVLKDKIGH